MQYWDIVTRSFRISWNHKYLWLIALFSGEGGAGFNFSYNQRTTGTTVSPAQFQQQVTTWINDHIGLIVFLIVLWLVLVIAFFILAAVCEGATVRAAAEHDAERPFGLGWAWRSGVATMWVIVRFRLLLVALALPAVLIVGGFIVATAVSFINQNGGAGAGLLVLGVLFALASIPYFIYLFFLDRFGTRAVVLEQIGPYFIYLFFLDRFGTRAVVLEQIGARAAIVRAHRLLFKRLGRSLLVLLLAIAVGIALGILFACALAIVAVPLAIIGAALFASGSAAVWPLIVVGVLILLPIGLVVSGFLSAQSSTYWTLAFRRLDLEPPAPQFYYQPAQPPQPEPPQVTS